MQSKSESDFNALASLLENNLKAADQAELNSTFQAEWVQIASRGRQLREISNALAIPALTERFQQIQQRASQVRAQAAAFTFPDPCVGCSFPVYPSEVATCSSCNHPISQYVCGNCRDQFREIPPCPDCSQ